MPMWWSSKVYEKWEIRWKSWPCVFCSTSIFQTDAQKAPRFLTRWLRLKSWDLSCFQVAEQMNLQIKDPIKKLLQFCSGFFFRVSLPSCFLGVFEAFPTNTDYWTECHTGAFESQDKNRKKYWVSCQPWNIMAGPAKATSTRVGNAKVKAHQAALNFEGWIDFVEVLERFELTHPGARAKFTMMASQNFYLLLF